jgi:methylglutaconyl-CoA hydratase
VGEAKAKHFLISGDTFSAEQARETGLVYEIVDGGALESRVMEFAKKLVETNSSHAMMLTKQMLTKLHSMSLLESLAIAADMNARARETEDFKRGIEAFLNKQKPQW